MVKLPNGKDRGLGFRFLITPRYPLDRPLAFLDAKPDPQIIEMVDYLDDGNLIYFDYMTEWKKANNYENFNP